MSALTEVEQTDRDAETARLSGEKEAQPAHSSQVRRDHPGSIDSAR